MSFSDVDQKQYDEYSFMKKVIEYSNQAMYVSDVEGMIILWNKKATDIFHYSSEEAIGKRIPDLLIPPLDRKRYTENGIEDYRQWLETVSGKTIVIMLINKEHDEILVNLHLVLEGDYVYSFVTSQNEQNTTIHNILDQSTYLIYAKDRQGRYIEINNGIERFLNKRRQDILGKKDEELFDPNVCVLYKEREREVIEKKESVTHEDPLEYNGEVYYFSTTRFPVKDEKGEVSGMWGISHDVTATRKSMLKFNKIEEQRLKENEQLALQSSKLKSDFLANMSHEIRTPINGILGLNNLLRDTELSVEQLDYVDGIHRSCGILMSIINDILDLSKVEAGRIELEKLDLELDELINDLQTFFSPLARSKNISFTVVDNFPNEKKVIKADYARMRQILTNVIGNAIKFTFAGGVTLSYTYLPEQNMIRFEIKDTGIGIPEEKVKTLFKPFTQADASTTRRFGGTGLGLSISKNFVAIMNGSIGVVSIPNMGSTFWIELPYHPGDTQAILEKKRKQSLEVYSKDENWRPLNVLIAEDNPMNQKVVIKTLEKMGHKPTAADNGLEALQLLQMNPTRFDLVLMDCSMPVLDGYDTTIEIRKLPLPIKKIPIIAMTANALAGEREHVLEIGMDDYMSKPFQRVELEKILHKWSHGEHKYRKSFEESI